VVVNLSLACCCYTPIDHLPQEKNASRPYLTEVDKMTTGSRNAIVEKIIYGGGERCPVRRFLGRVFRGVPIASSDIKARRNPEIRAEVVESNFSAESL
jgi:hypothetical protein